MINNNEYRFCLHEYLRDYEQVLRDWLEEIQSARRVLEENRIGPRFISAVIERVSNDELESLHKSTAVFKNNLAEWGE